MPRDEERGGGPWLRLKSLSFSHGPREVVKSLTLDLLPVRHYVIAGPNGAGKSTLLDLLARLRRPGAGSVLLMGRPLESYSPLELASKVSLAPQSTKFNFAFTVREVVRLGRRPYLGRWGRLGPEDEEAVERAMERLRLSALADKPEARELVSSLEPVITVASRLIQIREARPGETIGYDRTYEVEAPTRFGTAPIGYVHGLSRTRSSLGHALIGGREAGILGRVCMNLTMWDLRGNDARVGDEVVLVGRQGDALIGADRLAGWQRTSAYEILCHLGRANPRVYVRS